MNTPLTTQQLAESYCDRLAGIAYHVSSFMLLSAELMECPPAFLRHELAQESARRDWSRVHVDLADNLQIDAGIAVGLAFADVYSTLTNRPIRFAATQPSDFCFALADVITAVWAVGRKPVFLIIENAEPLLQSPCGLKVLEVLQSVSETLNASRETAQVMGLFLSAESEQTHVWYDVAPQLFLGDAHMLPRQASYRASVY